MYFLQIPSSSATNVLQFNNGAPGVQQYLIPVLQSLETESQIKLILDVNIESPVMKELLGSPKSLQITSLPQSQELNLEAINSLLNASDLRLISSNQINKENSEVIIDKEEKNKETEIPKKCVGSKYISVFDSNVIPRAILSLPAPLLLRKGIIMSRRTIPACCKFGPVKGLIIGISNDKPKELLLKSGQDNKPVYLIKNEESILHIDVTDQDKSNWFSLLTLGNMEDANIWLKQEGGELYAVTVQSIPPRSEIKLGYSLEFLDSYGKFEGLPVVDFEKVSPVKNHQTWIYEKCDCSNNHETRCDRVPASRSKRARFKCKLCGSRFVRQYTLKRHIRTYCSKNLDTLILLDYDSLFGPLVTEPETVFKIAVPGPDTFRDVTMQSKVPIVTEDVLETFCHLTERRDLETSKNMYNDYFLNSCRLSFVDNEFYITGLVASEMRKHITYNVTIKMKNNIILEAQCECAAGMGPFAQCKHVLVILFGLIDLNNKKNIKLKKSATSTLQTFHHPNALYCGEPHRAETLMLKKEDRIFKEMVTFDPRPLEERPSSEYSEDFKKLIKNFVGQIKEKEPMPRRTLLEPVAKEIVFKDHNYHYKTAEEHYLQCLILSEKELEDLEDKTKTNKKLWCQERLKRLQSSNFGKICKCNKGELELANSLAKELNIKTKAMAHGIKYENEAVKKFEEITKLCTMKCGIFVNKDYQFLGSTPDRLVGDDSVLEIKCPYSASNKKITPESVPYVYLCDKTGDLKLNSTHDYYYQVQGQMMCTGREKAYFCIYTLDDLVVIIIKKDNDFIKSMIEKLNLFYEHFFKFVILNRYLYNKK